VAVSKIGMTDVLKPSSTVIGVRPTDDLRAELSPSSVDVSSHPARPEKPLLIVPDAPPNQLEDIGADADRCWKREGMSEGRRNAHARAPNRVFVGRAACW
jgi:hypothetical protein